MVNGELEALLVCLCKDFAELRQQSIDDIKGLAEFLSGGEGSPVRVIYGIFFGFCPGLEGGDRERRD